VREAAGREHPVAQTGTLAELTSGTSIQDEGVAVVVLQGRRSWFGRLAVDGYANVSAIARHGRPVLLVAAPGREGDALRLASRLADRNVHTWLCSNRDAALRELTVGGGSTPLDRGLRTATLAS
jgi:hypothetical protein